jgi:pimeloyl-ACP methyl ester carboxylesterase
MTLTSTLPREGHLLSLSAHGFHRVVYYEWGEHDNPDVVICVHGIGRNGRDFDVLGEALAPTHRVLAPDMPGRGKSDWLRNPLDYVAPTYLTTLTALICASGVDDVAWVGTSMGALLGIMAASLPGTPVKRLVVNDAGPVLDAAALSRIGQYFGTDPMFATYDELKTYVKTISAPFGPLSDAQWEHVTRTNARQRADGRWGLSYDPDIAVPFRAQPSPPDLSTVGHFGHRSNVSPPDRSDARGARNGARDPGLPRDRWSRDRHAQPSRGPQRLQREDAERAERHVATAPIER